MRITTLQQGLISLFANTILLVMITCPLGSLHAQVGPGGVPATGGLWVKANVGLTLVGTDVSAWADQSGSGNNATQPTSGDRPDHQPVMLNYNPSVYFNGNNDHLNTADLVAATSTQVSLYAVGNNESGGDTWHSMVTGQSNGTNWINGGYGINSMDVASTTMGFWVNNYINNRVFTAYSNLPAVIHEGQYGSGSLEYYQNAIPYGSDAYAGQVGDQGTTSIGGGPGNQWNHRGTISEVIVYRTKLTATERRRVNSYLGLKYGRILDRVGVGGNIWNSAGNSIFSDGGVATYWRDVIGIGRDDNSALVQKQSQQMNDSLRLYLNTLVASNATNAGTFSANNQFMVMGHNGNATCITDDGSLTRPVSIAARMPRTWKITNTGFNGTFSVDIQLGLCGIVGTYAAADLRLLVDTDDDFSNATVYAPGGGLGITVVGGFVRVTGIANAHIASNVTRFITIGTVNYVAPPAPGGVYSGNVLWLQADKGVTLAGVNVSSLADQSQGGNNASQGTSGFRPDWVEVRDNYQPTIYYNGINDHLNTADLIAASSTAVSVLAVGTNESGGENWHSMVTGQANPTHTGGGYGITALDAASTTFGYWTRDNNLNRVFVPWVNRPAMILEGEYGSGSLEFYQNALLQGTDIFSGQVGDNGNTSIGGGPGTDRNHKGDIAEVVIYNKKLNAIERRRVNSYLAVKYGQTLDRISVSGSYVSSAGTAIYNDGGTATYWNDIIGIARDDASAFMQRQSRQYDDSTRIYIGTLSTSNEKNLTNIPANGQFVLMGHDKAKLCATPASLAEMPPTIYSRIAREWKVTNTAFTSTYSIDIKLNACAYLSSMNLSDLRLLVDDDGNFTNAQIYATSGGFSLTISGSVITVRGITTTMIPTNSTRFITLASNSGNTPLPIELVDFTAEPEGNKVRLGWTTASEMNNDHFTVERSADMEEWSMVSRVPSAGTSLQNLNYTIYDEAPLPNVSYYRLVQTDFDGTIEYSSAVPVHFNNEEPDIQVIPNPAQDRVMILFNKAPETKPDVRMLDLSGKPVNTPIQIFGSSMNIEVSDLPNGTYLVEVIFDGDRIVERLMVQH